MKNFYKEVNIIKWCTRCGVEFRPERYSWQNNRCICIRCVAEEIALWRKKNPHKWREIVRRYRKKARPKRLPWVIHDYIRSREWAKTHPEQRNEIKKRSYSRSKARG